MYFRFKKLCLLLRRFRSRFGRLQGDPKRTLGAAFAVKIRSKTDTYFWSIFIAFLKVLGRGYAMTLTWPSLPPHGFWGFRPRSVKIQCVFWYFAKRRFWHPVYFLFLWFSLSLLRRGDAAGSTTLTRNRPRHFNLGITHKNFMKRALFFLLSLGRELCRMPIAIFALDSHTPLLSIDGAVAGFLLYWQKHMICSVKEYEDWSKQTNAVFSSMICMSIECS